MRTEEEIRAELEKAKENAKDPFFWSGHIEGRISALEWVLGA